MSHSRLALALLFLSACGSSPALAGGTWWPDGAPVCRAPGEQTGIAVADRARLEWNSPADGIALGWIDARASGTSDLDVYAAFIDGGGPDTTSDGVAICRAAGSQADIAGAATGTWCYFGADGVAPGDTCWTGELFAWTDARDAGTDLTDIWAFRGGGYAWPADGIPICRQPGFQTDPVVCGDSLGGGIVAWVDRRGSDADVYAQRVDRYGHVRWAPDGIPVATGSAWQDHAAICPGPGAGAYVAWIEATELRLERLNSDGSRGAGWPAGGLLLGAPTETEKPLLVLDGSGGVIIVWDAPDPDSAGKVVPRATRYDSNGALAPGWPATGVALCGAHGHRELGDAVPDGTGGVFAVWTDGRAMPGGEALWPWTDIYGQRVNGAGVIPAGWPADGVAMCTQPEEQLDPRAESTPDSSVIVAWTDHRPRHSGMGTDSDIYASRLLADGTRPPNWPVDGLAVSTAPGAQEHPVVGRRAREDGATIAWEDDRNESITGVDVYAQNVTGAGRLLVPEAGGIARRLALSVAPNPARDAVTIRFALPTAGLARVDVVDIAGRIVRRLGEHALPAGTSRWTWDGRDERGHGVADGVYLVRVRTPSGVATIGAVHRH